MEIDNIILVSVSKGELKELIQNALSDELKKIDIICRNDSFDELLTRKEVAKIYHTSLVSLRDWEKRGLIPKPIRKGSRVLFRKNDIIQDIHNKDKK